jgi:metal-responsive CopG/Arc/MetJ family transcriptional regulator
MRQIRASVTISLPIAVVERLDDYAATHGQTRSRAVLAALELLWLEQERAEQEQLAAQ